MKIDPCIRKPWKITRDDKRAYSPEKIKKTLSLLNRITNEEFYVVDYRDQKLLTGITMAPTLCGYPRDVVQKEGLDFYNLILSKSEQQYLKRLNKAAMDIFFNYGEQERQNLEFSYNLIANTIDQHQIILWHKLIPYKLCENGNMGLGLCLVAIAPSSIKNKASIMNYETGEKYKFAGGKFVECGEKSLTSEEITILKLMAEDTAGKRIGEILKVSESYLKRKKQRICSKLGVTTSIGAACLAKDLGII